MANNVMAGLIAGAAGTTALNVVTYADMVLRGRPASETPAKLAEILAGKVGVDLSGDEQGKSGKEQAQSRQEGLGSLLGYVTGVGVGMLLAPAFGKMPRPLLGVTLGLAAIAASDVPMAAFGVSDPKEWATSDWVSDLIPHLIYGFVTAAVYQALSEER